MAPGSCARRSPCNNLPADPTGEQNELASPQSPERRSDAGSNEAPTPPEAPILPLIPPIEDLFTKFMKAFVESTQARDREQAKPWEQPFKARSSETYSGKSYINCYHFYQQCEDYFKTSGATGMNYTLFAVLFFRGTISLKWA